MSILQNIHGHDDLLRLSDDERTALCAELREVLVSNVSRTGGHLASNLGAVELTVAIETVFNTMRDRLVFDVGHQSYVHKLLTGRQADFAHLRQFGGIAGFPKPKESDADAFVAGHASSSVSIALGMARARTLQKQDYQVVALLGDGAATGGMIYEGLNDAAQSREPMVIILNDNEMSIDKNVGGLSIHLSRLRTQENYLGLKKIYRNVLSKSAAGESIYRVTKRAKDHLRRFLIPETIFENMGLTHLGPVDGHDLPGLISLLKNARDLRRPVVVHVLTKKGCGYAPAEQDPARFHGIGKFDPVTGNNLGQKQPTFSDAFGEALTELAREDHRVCAVTAAMLGGTGLLEFKRQFPERTFDVGIAEEHAVSMAGGLAKQGMIPAVAIYSTFLQRAFDQIMQDAAMLRLHVIFAVDRAGLVGEDGETHHGVFDTGFLRQIPGMTVLAPASRRELKQMLTWAVQEYDGPVAIRYPRGGDGAYEESHWDAETPAVSHREGSDAVLLTYGTMVNNAMEAALLLSQQGIRASVIRMTRISPLPSRALREAIGKCRHVFVVEEAAQGAALAYEIGYTLPDHSVWGIHLGPDFITQGSIQELQKHYGLDPGSIANFVEETLRNEK